MKIIDKILGRMLAGYFKTYSDAGTLSTYDRAFFDFMKDLKGDGKDYTGAIFNAMEVHGFYFSKAKFRLYAKSKNKMEELIDHPFLTMFNRPNSQRTWWETAYKIPV